MRNLKKTLAVFATVMMVAAGSQAAEHGYVSGILHDELDEKLYRVSVEKVNGKQASAGYNHQAHVGENTVTVSLVYSDSWGQNMAKTNRYVYMKDIEVDVEQGKHYFLAARVDTDADEAAIADGSFWEPVIAEVHD